MSPKPTKTELTNKVVGDEPFAPLVPTRRIADSSQSAAVAAFLVSDDASFMTGSEVIVDGGSAQNEE